VSDSESFLGAVIGVGAPVEEAFVGLEASDVLLTPREANRGNSQEVAMRTSLERTVGLERGDVVPLQAVQRSQGIKTRFSGSEKTDPWSRRPDSA